MENQLNSNGNKRGMNAKSGRPKINIDYKYLEKLCYLQCTEQEMADWFHCSVDTIERRIKEEFGVSFAEYFSEKRVGGKIALRRNLFQLSEKNVAAAIFLAKNFLGMTDKQEFEHSGYIDNAEKLSDEELEKIILSRCSRGASKKTSVP